MRSLATIGMSHASFTFNEGYSQLQRTTPFGPVELLELSFIPDEGTASIGCTRAIPSLSPSQVIIRHLPTRVRLGSVLRFELCIEKSADDLPFDVLLELVHSVAVHASFDIWLYTDPTYPQTLEVTYLVLPDTPSVLVSALIPSESCAERVCITSATFGGQATGSESSLPVFVTIGAIGLESPRLLRQVVNEYTCAPAISSHGVLYIPQKDQESVIAFNSDGSMLPSECIRVDSARLSNQTRTVAIDPDSDTLVLVDAGSSDGNKVSCLDLISKKVRWAKDGWSYCYSGAGLWRQGVFILTHYSRARLEVLRLSDGHELSCVPEVVAESLTADPYTSMVYASKQGQSISSFLWDGEALRPGASFVVPNHDDSFELLLTVCHHKVRGCWTSHVVGGLTESGTLLVFSLPDGAFVHSHAVIDSQSEGIGISGVCADPSGTSLAVCNSKSGSVIILPWPLPGMPE
jgi:hypothetical protein